MSERIEWGTENEYGVVTWASEEDARWAASLVPQHKVVWRRVTETDWVEG